MADATRMLRRTMPDLRAAVKTEMERQEVSAYKLAKLLKGKRPGRKDVPAQTIYAWLRGDNPLNSDDLGLVMDALGMAVHPPAVKSTPKPSTPAAPAKPRGRNRP